MIDPKVQEKILFANAYFESLCELVRQIRLENQALDQEAALDWFDQDLRNIRRIKCELDELVCN